jgi:WD40 repeat protein
MMRYRPLFIVLIAALVGTLANAQLSYGPARNLGGVINTPSIEVGPNLSAGSLTLYFVSDRRGGHSGTAELWMSTRTTLRDQDADALLVKNTDSKVGFQPGNPNVNQVQLSTVAVR